MAEPPSATVRVGALAAFEVTRSPPNNSTPVNVGRVILTWTVSPADQLRPVLAQSEASPITERVETEASARGNDMPSMDRDRSERNFAEGVAETWKRRPPDCTTIRWAAKG